MLWKKKKTLQFHWEVWSENHKNLPTNFYLPPNAYLHQEPLQNESSRPKYPLTLLPDSSITLPEDFRLRQSPITPQTSPPNIPPTHLIKSLDLNMASKNVFVYYRAWASGYQWLIIAGNCAPAAPWSILEGNAQLADEWKFWTIAPRYFSVAGNGFQCRCIALLFKVVR